MENDAPESTFTKLLTFSNSVEPLARNRDQNMTKNVHVYAIFYRPEMANDLISVRNVKTVER